MAFSLRLCYTIIELKDNCPWKPECFQSRAVSVSVWNTSRFLNTKELEDFLNYTH